jgi:Ca2+-dependent lipid-binding protein
VLNLKHARGVIAADVNGTSDPYCKVFLSSESHNVSFVDGWKTKIHWKTLNPEWNEVRNVNSVTKRYQTLTTPVKVISNKLNLLIEVWDKDHVGTVS